MFEYMSKKENMIREYETIREEILQKVELHNSLITFMVTTVVALLTFALTQEEPFLYLLSFCIIIPISMRVTYYRTMMIKLSAYVVVYFEKDIEGLKWETRNTQFVNAENERLYNKLTISHYYEGFLLGIVSYGLFVYNFIQNKNLESGELILVHLPIILLIWEWMITKRISQFDKERNKWISEWEKLRNNEMGK